MSKRKNVLYSCDYIAERTKLINQSLRKWNMHVDRMILEMWPYPSGTLHIGHFRNYLITDVILRHANLFSPETYTRYIGWDAFGLPAENAARLNNISASDWTTKNVNDMQNELQSWNMLYDWSLVLNTTDPIYYSKIHDIFILLWKYDLIYEVEDYVNWDPVDETILANEQVIDGKGWRSLAPVEKRIMRTFAFRISKYADELYADLESLNWPRYVINAQREWMRKYTGKILSLNTNRNTIIECYTVYPEYISNASFVALSFSHPLAIEYIKKNNIVIDYENFEYCKTGKLFGIKTDITAFSHTVGISNIPVYIANYIVLHHGTDAIYGAPEHSLNDRNFALQYNIQSVQHNVNLESLSTRSFCRLRDWYISRQRVWGTPIPFVFCAKCNATVPYRDAEHFHKRITQFRTFDALTKSDLRLYPCPQCSCEARVILDSMDTFVDSSFYYFLYGIIRDNQILDYENIIKYLPISYYVGGTEHAVSHLLYSRAVLRMLRDCWSAEKSISYPTVEPFAQLINQGFVHSRSYFHPKYGYRTFAQYEKDPDRSIYRIRDEKMSKSKLNTVSVSDLSSKYPLDLLRIFILSNYPIEIDFVYTDSLLRSVTKFYNSIINRCSSIINRSESVDIDIEDENIFISRFILIENKAKHAYSQKKYNKVISSMHEFINLFSRIDRLSNRLIDLALRRFIYIVYPIIPDLTTIIYQDLYDRELLYEKLSTDYQNSSILEDYRKSL